MRLSAASIRDVRIELLSVELKTGSSAARRGWLIAHSCVTAPPLCRPHPAHAVLRMPLSASVAPVVMGAPGIMALVIALIVIIALALASGPTVIVAAVGWWHG